ncbi:hypothetical protein SAMN05443247_09801 [Bradyrhizobium erythrophlei]|jgi:hypothetical protein|nr:hypothetical protein SAMN05443247_09801 [Bradyrhizobium erythrophlei]
MHSGRRKGGLLVINAAAPDDADLWAVDKQRCPLIGVSRTCAADRARSEKCQEETFRKPHQGGTKRLASGKHKDSGGLIWGSSGSRDRSAGSSRNCRAIFPRCMVTRGIRLPLQTAIVQALRNFAFERYCACTVTDDVWHEGVRTIVHHDEGEDKSLARTCWSTSSRSNPETKPPSTRRGSPP